MEEFLKIVAEFLSVVGMAIVSGLYYIFSFIKKWANGLWDELMVMLPSRSKILTYTYVSGTLFLMFLLYIIYINIKTYSLFVKDKENAIEKRRRVSEARLLKNCFFGGALGDFIGMQSARHKTNKPVFRIGVAVMLVVQVLLFSFVCGFLGFWIYMS